jgi:uncharacterized membrane protein
MSLSSGADAPPPGASGESEAPPGGPPSHAAWFAARRAAAAADEAHGSSTGLSPHTASVLCYVAAWLSAVIFLALERDSRLVRFHALQATFAFGFLCLLAILCGALTVLSAFYSTAAFQFFAVASEVSWLAMAVLWVVALVCVTRDANWRMPLVGRLAQRRV